MNHLVPTRIAATGLLLLATACPSGGEEAAFGGEIEFRGEQPLLPGLDVDTGWIPEGSPASVRATVAASGGVVVTARATTDGSALTPVAGSGALSMEGALTLELSARIDASGIQYEGVVESFEYAIAPTVQSFEPFSLGTAVVASADLPAQDLGSVPIPSVPGASLALEVTGGQLVTEFEGTCAEAADGHGQYLGTTTMHGTLEAAASIVIEIPLVGDETFGPFAFQVPIPAMVSPLDLGVRSLATGEPVDGVQVCGAVAATGGDTIADGPATDGPDDGPDDGPTTTGADDTSGGPEPTTTDDPTTTGDPVEPDPDYPPLEGGRCPPGYAGVGVAGTIDNAVCLPPCGPGDACPSGATGSAFGVCAVNPESSYLTCDFDEDCLLGESCIDQVCYLEPPTHCVLGCDDTSVCPDAMQCLTGVCSYPL